MVENINKSCNVCKEVKSILYFAKSKVNKYGVTAVCKSCRKIYVQKYRKNNREKIKLQSIKYYQENKERINLKGKEYRDNNKEKESLRGKKYRYLNKKSIALRTKKYCQNNREEIKLWHQQNYEENREEISLRNKEYRKNNREKINEKCKKRKREDVNFRLTCNLRSRINRIIRGAQKSGSAIKDLGCSLEELKQYLKSKFQPKMTWENYGLYGWHIDHIKPLSKFDLTKRKQFLEACHYTNLQPLWAEDNLKKSNIITT